MTLKELLNVTDPDTRVQVCIRLFGSMFKTERNQEYLLEDEEADELLKRKVETVRVIFRNEMALVQVILE